MFIYNLTKMILMTKSLNWFMDDGGALVVGSCRGHLLTSRITWHLCHHRSRQPQHQNMKSKLYIITTSPFHIFAERGATKNIEHSSSTSTCLRCVSIEVVLIEPELEWKRKQARNKKRCRERYRHGSRGLSEKRPRRMNSKDDWKLSRQKRSDMACPLMYY